jgi:hypothetical protein
MIRRRRRASLRGWWRVLPFVVAAGGAFATFTWLHSQILRNEYRSIELTTEIERVNDRLAELRGERYQLGRMKRMNEQASERALVEPKPGQIEIVRAKPEDLKAFEKSAPNALAAQRTRSVVVILETMAAAPQAPASAPAPEPSATMAQTAEPRVYPPEDL